jgi:hypothetical protein
VFHLFQVFLAVQHFQEFQVDLKSQLVQLVQPALVVPYLLQAQLLQGHRLALKDRMNL